MSAIDDLGIKTILDPDSAADPWSKAPVSHADAGAPASASLAHRPGLQRGFIAIRVGRAKETIQHEVTDRQVPVGAADERHVGVRYDEIGSGNALPLP